MGNQTLPDSIPIELEVDYWRDKLKDIKPLDIYTDYPRSNSQNTNKASVTFFIEEEVSKELNYLNQRHHVSLFVTLMAAYKILLYRYSNQEDICIGNAVLCSMGNKKTKPLINTLVLRSEINSNERFEELIQRLNYLANDAYQHLKISFANMADMLVKEQYLNINSLFRAMFIFQNEPEFTDSLFIDHKSESDLTFILKEKESEIQGIVEYNPDLYKHETILNMMGHYKILLNSIIKNPKSSIGALPMLTKAEEHTLLYEFNDTVVTYPKKKTLVDLFEEQVLKTPDAIALRQHEEVMSYHELNAHANQLARYLIEQGVKPEDNIGLLVTRSFNMIVGMFAILKAGGAYVPIDPEYPIDRQEYILHNSSVIKIIADNDYPLEELVLPDLFVKIKTLDLSAYSCDNPAFKIDSTQLAYTIYTSGSTGRPKGVMIEHHMAVNLVLWVNKEFKIGVNDRLLFITSMCFDLSVYDIFGMLSSGGSLVIVEQNELLDVPQLKDMMIKYKITFWDSVPTTMDYLIRELEAHDPEYLQQTLKVVFMSGDWIPVALPIRIKKFFPKTQVISLGGATEATVWSNYYPIKKVEDKWSSIPYGKPMNNNFFYILNEQLQPVPIGIAGELYIGGVGVARGYANDKEKTDYAFVKDPFNNKSGGRMYRTGDLGRMLPDLNMEFIGRKDDQVKIRGYRIELGEIESVLRQCNLISQAVVLAKPDKEKKKKLVGYVVGKKNYDRDTVISFLKSKLPDYMVPTLWVELDSIPLTSNGKIDKKALPDFNAEEQIKDQYVAPHTELQKVLVSIWENVLKVNNIGITHNFFDLGGHSLLAVQIVNQIKKETGKILPISFLFQYNNIELLSMFLKEDDSDREFKSLVPIKPLGNKEPIYFVHGVGLNVMNFADLAMYLDDEQPVFGLQALGLGGNFPSVSSLSEIAQVYVSEIIKHNPQGSYIIVGYSLGGFIATEMKRQFELRNKEVKILAIIDTFADYTDDFVEMLPKKLKRHINKWMKLFCSFIRQPNKTISTQKNIHLEEKLYRLDAVKLAKESGDKEYYKLLKHIRDTYYSAYRKSGMMTPFDDFVYLFRANECIHYTNDKKYLGWRKYALKGVKEYLVPGDHRTMLLKPNVEEFARVLQKVLNNSESHGVIN